MTDIHLSLACGDYEIVRPLRDGHIHPEGIDLTVLSQDKERIFRLDRRCECDVAEFNVIQYLKAAEAGEPLTALPVFLHRRFRHGSIYLRTDSGIHEPKDLEGRAVGIGGFEPAAAVWIRGILQDQYGLRLDRVDWQDVFGRLGRLPDGLEQPAAATDTHARHLIDDLLDQGELPATISAYNPPSFLAGGQHLRRLFTDPEPVEREYYTATGVFPIMHVVTIKQEVLQAHPWAAASLMSAFTAARKQGMDRLRNPRTLPLAFSQTTWESQDTLLGPDPWEYGLTRANRWTLQTAIRYAREQGITKTELDVDSLFARTDLEPSGPTSII
jgi:4,5-dihydroxyphthalate decarboxylase